MGRTNSTCNADPACKFCQLYEQGWTTCSNLTEDRSSSAMCDKSCSTLSDMYSCDSRNDCKWCSQADFSGGACKPNSFSPSSAMRCDIPSTGCASLRSKSSCRADPNCKFCTEFEQGWTFCTNITDDRRGDADCDASAVASFII